jgi:GT2 family glycosyltransferase
MKLSFVLVTYKRGELLQRCLDSITSQEGLPFPCEIVLIDNGGDAPVQAYTDDRFTLRVERSGGNLGAAGGRNFAMQLATGEYFIGLDDDALFTTPHDAANALAVLESDPQIGALAFHSRDEHGQPIRMEYPHPDKAFIAAQTAQTPVPHFFGVGHALRAEVIRKVGGYPERLFYLAEELDLALRIIDAGYRIMYLPTVTVTHFHAQAGRAATGDKYWRVSALNKSRVAFRLLPFPYPLTTLVVWSAAALIKTRRPAVPLAVWRDLWRERATLRAERRPIHPETVRYLRSIGARLWY